MALHTASRKSAAVRVAVTSGAIAEVQAPVLRGRAGRFGLVALRARYAGMQPREWETGSQVIEACYRFPRALRMTREAVGPQLTAVFVGVA